MVFLRATTVMKALTDPGGVERLVVTPPDSYDSADEGDEVSGTDAENDKNDKHVAAQDDDLMLLQQLREPVHNDDGLVDPAAAGPSAALAGTCGNPANSVCALTLLPTMSLLGRAPISKSAHERPLCKNSPSHQLSGHKVRCFVQALANACCTFGQSLYSYTTLKKRLVLLRVCIHKRGRNA
ncbi:hypothetical protein HDU88_007097 [Geranomyces variabilis]|nr:hypothetical protein HDU88_007097 [Geranomyces variabilis]